MKPHGEFCQCCCDRCDGIVIVLQYAEDELLNKRSKFNISFKYYSKCFFFLSLESACGWHMPQKKGLHDPGSGSNFQVGSKPQ